MFSLSIVIVLLRLIEKTHKKLCPPEFTLGFPGFKGKNLPEPIRKKQIFEIPFFVIFTCEMSSINLTYSSDGTNARSQKWSPNEGRGHREIPELFI